MKINEVKDQSWNDHFPCSSDEDLKHLRKARSASIWETRLSIESALSLSFRSLYWQPLAYCANKKLCV